MILMVEVDAGKCVQQYLISNGIVEDEFAGNPDDSLAMLI